MSAEGKGKAELGSLLNFLAEYVVIHFADEEALMSSSQYPELNMHKAIHRDFVNSLGETKRKFDDGEVDSEFVVGVLDETCQWLRDHIGKADKLVGDHLNAQ